MDIFFTQSKTNARIYPAYHTAYDTFDYCSKYIDPGKQGCFSRWITVHQKVLVFLSFYSIISISAEIFLVTWFSFDPFFLSGFVSHQAIARTVGNVLIRLADSLLLPLNCSDYAESLEDYLNTAVTLYGNELGPKNISMGNPKQGVSSGALNVMFIFSFDWCVSISGQLFMILLQLTSTTSLTGTCVDQNGFWSLRTWSAKILSHWCRNKEQLFLHLAVTEN